MICASPDVRQDYTAFVFAMCIAFLHTVVAAQRGQGQGGSEKTGDIFFLKGGRELLKVELHS